MNVAVIPARGGSRRIPRKNIRPFHGKPILAYSIETALMSNLFDQVIVSTDHSDIAEVAQTYGALTYLRNAHMARDEVGTQEVARDALMQIKGVEYACCIYATAPMMTVQDLQDGYDDVQKGWRPYSYVDGWFYWGKAQSFIDGVPLDPGRKAKPPASRWIDINTEEDWKLAEEMYARLHG